MRRAARRLPCADLPPPRDLDGRLVRLPRHGEALRDALLLESPAGAPPPHIPPISPDPLRSPPSTTFADRPPLLMESPAGVPVGAAAAALRRDLQLDRRAAPLARRLRAVRRQLRRAARSLGRVFGRLLLVSDDSLLCGLWRDASRHDGRAHVLLRAHALLVHAVVRRHLP